MVNFTILAGGYDTFVAAYLFCSATSSISLQHKSPTGQNPSWITAHPRSTSIIYAVNEVVAGAIQSFTVDQNGVLSAPQSSVPSGGDGPAYAVPLCTGEVAIMNYGGGNGRIIPTLPPGLHFVDNAPNITFPTPVNGTSHPHMALEYRDEIFVPDLGADTIYRLGREDDYSYNYTIHGSIPQPKGSGPRHIAVFGDRLFTLHEITSTLSVQAIPDKPNGTSPIMDTVSIIPNDAPPNSTFAAAEILIPPPTDEFPVPYIYVSNRNTGTPGPRGDSIAIFEHVNKGEANEGLKLLKQVYTGLNQIRGMEFSPSPHEYLTAGAAAGKGGVVVLCRTDQGKNLDIVASNTDIPTRTSFVWL